MLVFLGALSDALWLTKWCTVNKFLSNHLSSIFQNLLKVHVNHKEIDKKKII